MFESKPTEKKPWLITQEHVAPLAISKLGKLGIKLSDKKKNPIIPKNWQDFKFNHILLKPYEFNGDCYFVLVNSSWDQLVDNTGKFICYAESAKEENLKIYQVKSTPNFADVYTYTDFNGTTTNGSYQVPITDLVEVVGIPVTEKISTLFDLTDTTEDDDDRDENINGMTIKDFYAIIQSVPVSNKTWLNELIKKTNIKRS